MFVASSWIVSWVAHIILQDGVNNRLLLKGGWSDSPEQEMMVGGGYVRESFYRAPAIPIANNCSTALRQSERLTFS